MIIIISGLQGVGKTTIIKELLLMQPQLRLAISATTRSKRVGEDNREYEFLTEQEFQEKEENGYFMEVITFNNNKYGTPKKEFAKNTIFNVTASSIENFTSFIGDNNHRTIFLNAEHNVIRERLQGRGEKSHEIHEKIELGLTEKTFQHHFQYVINNDNLTTTVQNIIKIINTYS